MLFFLAFVVTQSLPLPRLRLQVQVCLDNRSSAYASPLALLLRHSGQLWQCYSVFCTTNILSCERPYEEGSLFTSMKVFALLYAKQKYCST